MNFLRSFPRRLAPLALLLGAGCAEQPLLIGDLPPPSPPLDCAGLWQQTLTDPSAHVFVDHAVDAHGDIVVALDLGAGLTGPEIPDADIVVRKLDGSGALVWEKHLTAHGTHRTTRVAVDGSGDVLLAGSLDGTLDLGSGAVSSAAPGDPFLVKLDPQGAEVWAKTFATSPSDFGPSTIDLATGAADHVVIFGELLSELDLGGATLEGFDDAYVASLDAQGQLLWAKALPHASLDAAVVNGAGEVGLSGSFTGTLVLGGSAAPISAAGSDGDLFVARLDTTGTALYALGFGTSEAESYGPHLALAVDGSALLTDINLSSDPLQIGSFTVPKGESYVLKLDPTGQVAWGKLGNNHMRNYAMPSSVALDPEGTVFVVGSFTFLDVSPLESDPEAAPDLAGCVADADVSSTFVLGLGPSGALLSCRRYATSDTGLTLPTDIFNVTKLTPDGSGKLVMSGAFAGHIALECGNLDSDANPAAGEASTFLAKIAP